jgi:hypothetical protein
MSPTPEPPEPSDPSINPYDAPESSERAAPPPRRRGPGAGTVIVAVVVGLLFACVAFFVTCIGAVLVMDLAKASPDDMISMALFASILTAIAAFAFTVWGIIKLNEPYR